MVTVMPGGTRLKFGAHGEAMGRRFRPYDPSQQLLLPEDLCG